MLALKVTPIVGLPQFTGWSQVAESTASVSSRVICVFSVQGKHAGNVGRDISEQIADFYYYDPQQFHEFLQKLVEYAAQNSCVLYFSVAVLNKTRSVFAAHGGSIFLRRGEKAGKILISDLQIKLIEGDFNESDTFILTTQHADTFLNEIQQKYLQGFETDTIITSVVPGLHSQADSSLSAMVFISQGTPIQEQEVTESTIQTEIESEPELPPEIDLKGNPAEIRSETSQLLSQTNKNTEADDATEENVSIAFEVSSSNKTAMRVLSGFSKLFASLLSKIKQLFLAFFAFLLQQFKKLPELFLSLRGFHFKEILQRFSNKKSKTRLHVPRKINIKVLIVIGFLLGITAIVGYVVYARNQEAERISQMLQPISMEISQIRELANDDPISARDQLRMIQERVQTLEAENQESSSVQQFEQLQSEITEFIESISGQEELSELDIFYDLRLVKSDYIASQIDLNTDTVLLLDAQMKEALLLNFDTKEVELKELSEFESVIDAVLTPNESVVLLADGIQEFSISQDSDVVELRTSGDSNRTGTLIETYDRFIYVVNPEKRNIYRYAESEDQYSEPIGWMRGAPGVDYEEIVSLRIDGDVWLSTQTGDIRKFASGTEESFEIRGLDPVFESEVYVFTNENLENLYVLDPSNNRVVVLTKTGDFVKEFISVSLGAANGIAVSEENNIILITAGSLIYQIPINN